MGTTRQYLIGCTWCNATGQKFPMQHDGTDFSSICPVCKGNKTVICTETIEDDEIPDYTKKIKTSIDYFNHLREKMEKFKKDNILNFNKDKDTIKKLE